MSRSRPLSARETRMWQKVAKSVRRLETRHPDPPPTDEPEKDITTPAPRQQADLKSPAARPRASEEDLKKLTAGTPSTERKPPEPRPGLAATFSSGIADRGGERKIRRGKFDLGPVLDLHGHTQDSAKAAVIRFVQHHRAQNEHSVLIITGKGRAGGGILRQRFLDWISEPGLKEMLSGYAQAHKKHGGEGAFYLFLRRIPKRG